MIETIRSLDPTNPLELRLTNKHSKLIYRIDSINLLIGVNGSGKTETIKSIINDLLARSAPERFIAEGDTSQLGIIYYTSVPFHRSLPFSSSSHVSFADASRSLDVGHSFIQVASDYNNAASSLGIRDTLTSNCIFDLARTALRIAKRNHFSAADRNEHPDFSSMLDDVRRADIRYRQLERQKRALARHLSSLQTVVAASRVNEEANVHQQRDVAGYDQRLAAAARDRLIFEQALADRVLTAIGPSSLRELAVWIAYSLLEVSRPGLNLSRISSALLKQDYDDIFNRDPDSELNYTVNVISDFLREIDERNFGRIVQDKHRISLSIDIPKFLESGLPPSLVEEAAKLKLVEVGFSEISAGQAAIFHQVVSISNSVRQQAEHHNVRKFLIFIDEGDMLLHLDWQRRYLSLVDGALGKLKEDLDLSSVQVVVATHSPFLASDALKGSITQIGETGKVLGFGAPLQAIVNYSFKTKSIGAIAERTINNLRKRERFSDSEMQLIEQIDDDFIKSLLKQGKTDL